MHIYLYGHSDWCCVDCFPDLRIRTTKAAAAMQSPAAPKPQALARDGITLHGWTISTQKGPIIADRDTDAFRQAINDGCSSTAHGSIYSLPEMLFDQNRVTLHHEGSGVAIELSALDALAAWRQADNGAPLQVSVAKAWKSARQDEIQQQKAIQLEYDWTYTTPYCGTIVSPVAGPAESSCSSTVAGAGEAGAPSAAAGGHAWEATTEQIDRSLLMERDPIIFFDEVILYESDLDDNGVCLLTAKIRVMPKCWFVLMRLWIRVDGSMVRLRETRLFCRHDLPHTSGTVLREVRHSEGVFAELRAAGAPDEGPAYADADAAAAVFQAVAPTGVKLFRLEKMQLS